VVLAVIYHLAVELPKPECGEGGGASSLEMTLFTILVAVVAIGCLSGAVVSLRSGWRRADSGRHWVSKVLAAAPFPLYLFATALCCVVILFLVEIGQTGLAC
jgi:hypothetical protein